MKRRFGMALPWDQLPRAALLVAAALLIASVALAFQSERAYRGMEAEKAEVQARILAASISAALAFDDQRAAQDLVEAFETNPQVMSVGAYRADGVLLASFGRAGYAPPPQPSDEYGPRFESNLVTVLLPVQEGGVNLGAVFLRAVTDPFSVRLSRYGGTALLVLMAALIVAVLGAAQAALARAHSELGARAAELAETNRLLQEQIEERSRVEETLRQMQKLEAVGQLTGGVAHDFNNLLQALSGCLQMIQRRSRDPGIKPFVDAGVQAVNRGAKLTRQLLAFARRQALRPETVHIHDQLMGMSELLARSLRADIRLEIDLEQDLWPVEVDPVQFELAILNLAVNARDAMPSGGALHLRGRNLPGAPDRVEVSLGDTGTGMDPDVLSRAFEPFFTTKEVGKGSGLGLSQVYGFAQQSGGDVHIDSRPGVGTTVTVRLPRATGAPRVKVQGAETPAAAVGGGKVLLVEDDPIVSAILSATLEDMGYGVTKVHSGQEALPLLNSADHFDVLLTDVVMPGDVNGVALARAARQSRPGLKIVLMSGYSENLDPGEFELLAKPYRRENLISILQGTASATGQVAL